MSKYGRYSLKGLRHRETILAALAQLGYTPNNVEVHEQPVTLYGISGDARAEKAEIVIRKHNTGIGSSNDLGIARKPDGTWEAIVSDYDSHALCRVMPNGKPFVEALATAYRSLARDRAVKTILTTTIPKLKALGVANGGIPANATVQRTRQGNATRIVALWQ